ncbi:hypothetical protein AWB75_05491 [Caballeronia catudaia]|uniref:Uncharacterized protein n=1 Tax=Caballeronia catudaia TaxID=1777136 RepID=A0A158CP05_9BURK|nr:hypothetical protein AWB75_05491 [Caballeronia catudaia]
MTLTGQLWTLDYPLKPSFEWLVCIRDQSDLLSKRLCHFCHSGRVWRYL